MTIENVNLLIARSLDNRMQGLPKQGRIMVTVKGISDDISTLNGLEGSKEDACRREKKRKTLVNIKRAKSWLAEFEKKNGRLSSTPNVSKSWLAAFERITNLTEKASSSRGMKVIEALRLRGQLRRRRRRGK